MESISNLSQNFYHDGSLERKSRIGHWSECRNRSGHCDSAREEWYESNYRCEKTKKTAGVIDEAETRT